jgi:putative addiction module component (TIGR02574 family)
VELASIERYTTARCILAGKVRRNIMGSAAEELEAAALSLPRDERARLAERLIASLDEDAEIEQAWAVEVRRRLEAFRTGEIVALPLEEVLREARQRIQSA